MKQGAKGYEWREVATCTGTYRALVRKDAPHLCFHDRYGEEGQGWYTVTHVPSGNSISNCEGRERAQAVIDVLRPIAGLEVEAPTAEAIQAGREAIVKHVATPVPGRESAPVPSDAPIQLTPVYRPGFTPSRQVRAADRKVALLLGKAMAGTATEEEWAGFKPLLEQATTLRWREEIRLRVPGIEDEEIPMTIPDRLRDGTPLGYDGFVASRTDLDLIGDELAWLAERVVLLAKDYLGPGWEAEDYTRWTEYAARWKELVCEGWMEWTAAAAHYHACTEEEQAEITRELGFVGSHEHGYHPLGEKTFLRHPIIREAFKQRLAVKEHREGKSGT